MNDPARIDRILARLREAWLKVPDWRLGQVIHNAVNPRVGCEAIFCVDDETMEKLLSELTSALPPVK